MHSGGLPAKSLRAGIGGLKGAEVGNTRAAPAPRRPIMKDAFALAAAAIWFALHIGLWAMRLPALTQLALSVLLGAAFFAAFFLYLGHKDRRRGLGARAGTTGPSTKNRRVDE